MVRGHSLSTILEIIVPLLLLLLLAAGSAALGQAESDGKAELHSLDTFALRRAIDDLAQCFPHEYTSSRSYLDRLESIESAIAALDSRTESDSPLSLVRGQAIVGRFQALQREALIANPLVSGRPILFVVRHQYAKDHHNTATLFQTGEINTASFKGGAALKTIDFNSGGTVKTLLVLADGVVRDPEVHFSGGAIIFSLRENIDDDYHICEIDQGGRTVRTLTAARGVSDIDPVYLPDDTVIFSSTREPKYCMCNRHIMANLFRMERDGANIRQVGKSTLFEGHAALLPDGRILYDRWEYVDRNFGDAQGLWTMNPDGTNHAVYFGNNTNSPGGVIDARPIPGTQKALCILGSCHDRPWGALAIVDRRRGLDAATAGAASADACLIETAPVERTWPADASERLGRGNWDAFLGVTPKYEDPYPLSDKYFLCSRTTRTGDAMGICLVDIFGNEVMIHEESPGCFDPMPVGPRPRPPAAPARRNLALREGAFYVVDVYQGTHMDGVERGAVKSLRVIESPEKRYWTHASWGGQGVHCPAMNWHDFNNKRILGTVPVESDGSAYFTLPADRFVYFQLLDGKGKMIQSMRSGTIARPGELNGCVGCHDDRRTSPLATTSAMPLAARREPSRLDGWHGPPRLFNYMTEVQPVFDRACVRCHDYGAGRTLEAGLEAARNLNLAADRTLTFNTSYNEIWRKKLITVVGAGPAQIQKAYSWGSHASRLVEVLDEGHHDVELSAMDFDRIVTWIDLNAPFYPSYASAFPQNLAGRSPLDSDQIERLSSLTGVAFGRLAGHAQNQGPQISFDRPELSPCLERLRSGGRAEYAPALAIIYAGAERLDTIPRADMDGFEPCAADRQRRDKYDLRLRAEERSRQAMLNGKKIHDNRSRE